MSAGREGTWLQCQNCGHVYYIEKEIPINKLYVTSVCPRCDEYIKGLNCGNNKDDLYSFYNVNMDPRYYEY